MINLPNPGVDSRDTNQPRPLVVKVLVALFAIGAVASFLSFVALTFPGSFLEPIWRLNPPARAGFDRLGVWSIPLMILICIICTFTVIGLWRGVLWGYWLAIMMLALNMIGNTFNFLTGTALRAVVAIPIVLLVLFFMLRKSTREYFIRAL